MGVEMIKIILFFFFTKVKQIRVGNVIRFNIMSTFEEFGIFNYLNINFFQSDNYNDNLSKLFSKFHLNIDKAY